VGLEDMSRDGSLRRFVLQRYNGAIRKVDFCQRRVFKIDDPNLTPESKAIVGLKNLWFDPYDGRNEACSKSIP